MGTLQYFAPTSAQEAAQLLHDQTHGQVLAGGTDLLVQMRTGIKTPAAIIDIKKIPQLTKFKLNQDTLVIGAALSCAELVEQSSIAEVFPGLVEAADLIGSTQIQGRCTLGGNLCNASPAADTVPALIVNKALCLIQGREGQREVAVAEFNTGPGQNCLAQGEFLLSFKIPRPSPGTADAYLRFIPRTEMDIAVVGAAASITLSPQGKCTGARIAIGAVAPTALLVPAAAEAIIGSRLEDKDLDRAVKAVQEAAKPISDKRGSADYRRKVVGVLTRRAIKIAQQRAQNITV